jgi:hypothetical protein
LRKILSGGAGPAHLSHAQVIEKARDFSFIDELGKREMSGHASFTSEAPRHTPMQHEFCPMSLYPLQCNICKLYDARVNLSTCHNAFHQFKMNPSSGKSRHWLKCVLHCSRSQTLDSLMLSVPSNVGKYRSGIYGVDTVFDDILLPISGSIAWPHDRMPNAVPDIGS